MLVTLTFYFVAIATAIAFSVTDPGGPCTPAAELLF